MPSYTRKGLYRPKGQATFVIRVTFKGQRIFETTGTADEVKAAEYYDRFMAKLWERERLGAAPEYTWDDAVKLYLEKKAGIRTLDDSIMRFRWLDTFLGGRLLAEIDNDLIDAIAHAKRTEPIRNTRLARKGQKVSETTVNRYMDLVRTVLNLAHKRKWVLWVPHIERAVEPERVRWLTDVEITRLMAALSPHYRPLVQFALSTGLRAVNIRTLRWDQIDMPRRRIFFRDSEMKNKKYFVCYLNQDAMDAIMTQMGKHPVYVFIGHRGQPLQTINTGTWTRALKRAGLENVHFHDLRHTWATKHLFNGTPLHVLKDLGGWSSLDMVKRYAHLVEDKLAEAANNVSVTKLPRSNVVDFQPWKKAH